VKLANKLKHIFNYAWKVIILLTALNTFAAEDNPYEKFSTSKNITFKSTITWRVVSNVQAECDKESKRLAGKKFNYQVLGCSFWEEVEGNSTCTIITGKTTTMFSLGHETRHCFQGNWHE